MIKKPIIGILLDWYETGMFYDRPATRPFYGMEEDFFNAIITNGGVPVALPCITDHIPQHIEMIDGLLCPGGNYASPPEWYINGLETTYQESPRATYEIELIRQVLDANKPVLAICGGMQVMSAAFGCKMVPDLHKHFDTDINHKTATKEDGFAFRIDITPGTHLSKIVGQPSMRVNSYHREAVVTHPENVVVSAIAEDGVIQGVEIPAYDFAVGVQWHPEMFVKDDKGEPGHNRLFDALIKKAVK